MRAFGIASLILVVLAVTSAADPAGHEPLPADQWDFSKAAHLLSRAGFGGTPAEIANLGTMSFEEAVSWIVDYDSRPAGPRFAPPVLNMDDPGVKRRIRQLSDYNFKRALTSVRYEMKEDLERALAVDPKTGKMTKEFPRRRSYYLSYIRRILKGQKKPATPENVVATLRQLADQNARRSIQYSYGNWQFVAFRDWWLSSMVSSPRPLQEKLVLFWHGHFATSYAKVRNATWMQMQQRLFRGLSMDFGALVRGICQDPAMLRYLDGERNIKGRPNENFARELLELFTIGIGHYTEKDIKEAARAFTGWYVRGNKVALNPRTHDGTSKTFMGWKGNWGAEDIVRIVLEQPHTSTFIAGKLARYFMGYQPDKAFVDELAMTLRKARFQLRPMLKQLFSSRAFYDKSTVGKLVKSPVQLVVGTIRRLGMPAEAAAWCEPLLARMGQWLFYPPNVKGWDGGRTWINAATLLERYNFMRDLLTQGPMLNVRSRYFQLQISGETTRELYARLRKQAKPEIGAMKTLLRLASQGPDALIDHLAARLLSVPLPAARRAKLRTVLGDASDEASIRSLLILLTSLPEYQLG